MEHAISRSRGDTAHAHHAYDHAWGPQCAPLPSIWGLASGSFQLYNISFRWCLLSFWWTKLKAGPMSLKGWGGGWGGRGSKCRKCLVGNGGGIRAEWAQCAGNGLTQLPGSRDHPADKLILSWPTDRWEAADLMLTSGNAEHGGKYQAAEYNILMHRAEQRHTCLAQCRMDFCCCLLGSVLLTTANWSII